ncbi:MAG: heavy-metal-associated domain-containing protein [candidate division Zixibacteria bacterium]|nr:heavy-metal-associated domain-containing protein [candidate division Zixibacteria bacterium]
MKLINLLTAALIVMLFVALPCLAEEKAPAVSKDTSHEAIMKIDGMTCMGCVGKVKKSLSSIEGVKSCDVSLEESRATVVFTNDVVTDTDLVEAVKKLGYKVQLGEVKAAGSQASVAGCVTKKKCSKTCSKDKKGCATAKDKKACDHSAKSETAAGDKK